MSTLTSNPKMAQFKRGLSVVAERMPWRAVVKNFRNKIIGVILAGVLAPQASFAGGHGQGGMSHGGHSSSGSSMKSFQRSSGPSKSFQGSGNKQSIQKSPSNVVNRQSSGNGTNKKVIAAKNGNTGISRQRPAEGQPRNLGRQATRLEHPRLDESRSVYEGFEPERIQFVASASFQSPNCWQSMASRTTAACTKVTRILPRTPRIRPRIRIRSTRIMWCHNGFPWLWGIYPPVGFYPTCPVVISQPTPVYVDAPVAVAESQPLVTQPAIPSRLPA